MSRIKAFCARKGVVCSFQHYGVDALGAIAQGLFCTLLVGTILNTLGQQLHIGFLTAPVVSVGTVSYTVGALASAMVGFAVMSFKENRWGGLVAQGVGTSMLQMPNILKNPRIWIPPTLASMITGPLATCVFKLQMNGSPVSSGMGTCGFVGQIGVYTGWVSDIAAGAKAAITPMDWIGLLLICFILPAVLSTLFCRALERRGLIREGDMKLDL